MSSLNKYLEKIKVSSAPDKLSLFKDDNENGGIFVKSKVIAELEAAGDKHPAFVGHTKRLINLMLVKHPFSTEPLEGFEHGMPVIWCNLKRVGNYKPTLCVPKIDGMAELIDSYYHGKVEVNIDFDEFVKQAEENANRV